jgi:trk system potassium uptake protein TrkA
VVKVVILGCGRVGSLLALRLDEKGHQVAIVDKNGDAFLRLEGSNYGGQMVRGTGIDVDVLREAGIEGADAFIACTSGDNTNITAAQIVREVFGVPRVIARINDPIREAIFHDLGLETVCPTTMGAEIVRDMLVGGASRGR